MSMAIPSLFDSKYLGQAVFVIVAGEYLQVFMITRAQ